MNSKNLISTIGIGLAAASVSILARKTVQKTWEGVIDEPAPKDKPSDVVDFKEAMAWAAVSGISAGVARMLVHYVMDKREKNKM